MNRLEMSDWLVLNNLIYKIYTTKDVHEMRKKVLEQLKLILDFDGADFSVISEDDGKVKFSDTVTYNCELSKKFEQDEEKYFNDILENHKSVVFRETDIIPDEKRVNTRFYRNTYVKNNFNYAIHMFLAKDSVTLGQLTLYRTIGKENFAYDDVVMLDLLKEHLSFCLKEAKQKQKESSSKLTITEAARQYELTKREEMILHLLMEGDENEEICNQLGISVNTLKKHVLNIYRKLGIKNRVQMFKMILEKTE